MISLVFYSLVENSYVSEVQSRVYFIHDVQRCRLIVMEGEDQS